MSSFFAIGWIAPPLLLILLSGCSPLEQVVRADAPGFKVKKPALGQPELGRRILSGQAETNACFQGTLATEAYKSWSNRTLTYSAGGSGKLQGDFGSVIQLGVGVSADRKLSVTLKDMSLEKLESLFFDPKGPCATDDALRARYTSAEGVTDIVITRALRANTITISDSVSGSVNLTVKATLLPVGGEVGPHGQRESTWQGAELYIAHYLEPFKVTLKAAPACMLAAGAGQSCDLEACSVKIDSLGTDHDYGATLSCQDGTSFPISAKLGSWDGQRVAPGVSYSLRVNATDKVGLCKVELFRWNVLSK